MSRISAADDQWCDLKALLAKGARIDLEQYWRNGPHRFRHLDPYLLWLCVVGPRPLLGPALPQGEGDGEDAAGSASGGGSSGTAYRRERSVLVEYVGTNSKGGDGIQFIAQDVDDDELVGLLKRAAQGEVRLVICSPRRASVPGGPRPQSTEGKEADYSWKPSGALSAGKADVAKPVRVVVGLIDDGFPFANARLGPTTRTGGRLRAFWDQRSTEDFHGTFRAGQSQRSGNETSPPDKWWQRPPGDTRDARQLGARGRLLNVEMLTRQLDQEFEHELTIYREALHLFPTQRWSHGGHVADLACGEPDPLSRLRELPMLTRQPIASTDIVLVELPSPTSDDLSGGALGAEVLRGIDFIVAQAAEEPVIVNLSYGTFSGPHDGTSLFERALKERLDRHRNLHLVLPAGNSHVSRCHAAGHLQPAADGSVQRLHWRVLPDDPTDSFLEIWLPRDASVEVRLTPPDFGAELRSRSEDGAMFWWGETAEAGQRLRAMVARVLEPANSTSSQMVLIAVSPTWKVESRRRASEKDVDSPRTDLAGKHEKRHAQALAPQGIWTVELRNEKTQSVYFHAYIQRDDNAPGRTPGRNRRGGRQSSFVESWTDPRCADPVIKPEGNLNGIATFTHERLFVAGAMDHLQQTISRYSAGGPDRSPGFDRMEGPDVVVVGDESPNVPGLLAAGVLSASRVRLSGTSVAAAVTTRLLAEHLAAGHTWASFRPPSWLSRQPSRCRVVPVGAPQESSHVLRGESVRKPLPNQMVKVRRGGS